MALKGLSITRALRHRNYRLFFFGQGVSLIGTWLTRTATSWLVYKLSHSGLTLGVVNFAGLAPVFLITPLAGVLVDRWNKHRVLVATQVCAALQSAALAILTLAGHITVAQIVILSVIQGLINAFDFPVRQSFVVQMIDDKKDLPNAIALNSSIVNLARLLGPTFAGLLIASVGEGACFAIDAISYLAVIATLLMMSIPARPPVPVAAKHFFRELREGVQYAVGSRTILSVLGLFALVSFMGVPYLSLLPMIVGERLSGGARDLGYLTAASGCGALVGVLLLGSRKSSESLVRIITWSSFTFGAGLICFCLSRGFWLSLVTLVFTGLGMVVQTAASNTEIQTVVDEDKRGRVMSLFATAYAGMAPLGSLFGGFMADRVTASATLLWGGVICCVGAFAFSKLHVRHRAIAV